MRRVHEMEWGTGQRDSAKCDRRNYRFHYDFSLKSLYVSFNNLISDSTISTILRK